MADPFVIEATLNSMMAQTIVNLLSPENRVTGSKLSVESDQDSTYFTVKLNQRAFEVIRDKAEEAEDDHQDQLSKLLSLILLTGGWRAIDE